MSLKHELPVHETCSSTHIKSEPKDQPLQTSNIKCFTKYARDDLEALNVERRASWKVGYQGLSRKFASPDESLLLRRFGELNIRVLLKLQNEIVQLERKLRCLDQMAKDAPKGGCGSLRLDEMSPRGPLLDELKSRLKEYNEQLKSFAELQGQSNASPEQIRELQKWLQDRPYVIELPEQEFAYRDDDLVSLSNQPSRDARQPSTWLPKSTSQIGKLCSKNFRDNSSDLQSISSGILPVLSTVETLMLFSPAWAMAFTCDSTQRLFLLGLFTLWFFAFLQMNSRRMSLNRGLAMLGYCSILAVMLCLTPSCAAPLGAVQTSRANASVTCCTRQTAVPGSDLYMTILALPSQYRAQTDVASLR